MFIDDMTPFKNVYDVVLVGRGDMHPLDNAPVTKIFTTYASALAFENGDPAPSVVTAWHEDEIHQAVKLGYDRGWKYTTFLSQDGLKRLAVRARAAYSCLPRATNSFSWLMIALALHNEEELQRVLLYRLFSSNRDELASERTNLAFWIGMNDPEVVEGPSASNVIPHGEYAVEPEDPLF